MKKRKMLKLAKKQPMTNKAARRIQSSQDKKGTQGDIEFKSRAMRAASKNKK